MFIALLPTTSPAPHLPDPPRPAWTRRRQSSTRSYCGLSSTVQSYRLFAHEITPAVETTAGARFIKAVAAGGPSTPTNDNDRWIAPGCHDSSYWLVALQRFGNCASSTCHAFAGICELATNTPTNQRPAFLSKCRTGKVARSCMSSRYSSTTTRAAPLMSAATTTLMNTDEH